MTFPPMISPISIYAGDTFTQSFVFTTDGVARNLVTEGWGSWTAQIRSVADAPTYVSFTVDSSGAAEGRITLSLSATLTRQIGDSVFDLQATKGATVQTFMRGSIAIVEDVTRV